MTEITPGVGLLELCLLISLLRENLIGEKYRLDTSILFIFIIFISAAQLQ